MPGREKARGYVPDVDGSTNLWQSLQRYLRVFGVECACRTPHCQNLTRVVVMLDLLMIVCGVGFFVAALFYVVACEKM